VEIILQTNEINVSLEKASHSIDITKSEYNTNVDRNSINIELLSREYDVGLIEEDLDSSDINVYIEKAQSDVALSKNINETILTKEVIEPDFVKGDNNFELDKEIVECELVLQPSIIHLNPEALPQEAFCAATDLVGDSVYIYDNKFTNKLIVRRCDITDLNKMPAIGIIVEKITSTECKIKKIGEVNGYSGFIHGGMLVVGLNGQPIHPFNLPDPNITPHYLQVLGVASNSDTALLHIDMTLCKRIK